MRLKRMTRDFMRQMGWAMPTARLLLPLALCATAGCASDAVLAIPAWTTPVDIGGQPVQVTLSGSAQVVRGVPGAAGQPDEGLRLNLLVDLTDLNAHLTDLLRERIHQDDRCGVRIDLQHAVLRPASPGANLVADAHVESFVCAKAFGKKMSTRLLGGDATIEVRLTPRIEEGQTLKMDGEVVAIRATGALGDLLRSEPLGSKLREKLASSVANALHRCLERWKESLPPQARDVATIESARFADPGPGRLGLVVRADVRVPVELARGLLEKLHSGRHDNE
jgi:hypothetical protein